MWDLEVADLHDFVVVAAGHGIVVHNCSANGGIGPVQKGSEGVRLSIEREIANGSEILGTEVTIQTPAGRSKVDVLVRKADGNLTFIESKNGPTAGPNNNQLRVWPEIEAENGIAVGKNARLAGFDPGSEIGPIPVQVDYWGR